MNNPAPDPLEDLKRTMDRVTEALAPLAEAERRAGEALAPFSEAMAAIEKSIGRPSQADIDAIMAGIQRTMSLVNAPLGRRR